MAFKAQARELMQPPNPYVVESTSKKDSGKFTEFLIAEKQRKFIT